jgi:hypothetical protein
MTSMHPLLAGLALLALVRPGSCGQCRNAQIIYRVDFDGESIGIDRTPTPYGRGILCQRFVMADDSAPVVMRITMRPESCDPAHPEFNRTHSSSALLRGENVSMGLGDDDAVDARRRTQNPDFPPGCGSGSGARVLPTDAYGGARDCQESCMWCSASLWMGFAVHFEDPDGVAEPFCQPIRCAGE